MTRVILTLTAALALAPAAHAAIPGVQAHRGGPVIGGVPTFAEESLPAFRNAAQKLNTVLEIDAKLTEDDIPVAFHDDTLDRTTACTGLVRDKTLAELAACPVDVLGAPGNDLETAPAPTPVPIATLAEVLAFAKADGIGINLEIKNYPTDDDYDPTDAFANRIMDIVLESKIPANRVIIQSFTPPNLAVAERRMPDADKAFLALAGTQDLALQNADASNYEWVSPAWPVDKDYVDEAHSKDIKVVPYTINKADQVQAAADAGVDALITDDPFMALKTLDKQGPKATLRARTTKLAKVKRSGKLPLTVTLDEAGTANITARLGGKVAGTARVEAGRGGGSKKVALRLSGPARKRLAGMKRATFKLVAKTEDVVENRGSARAAAKLR